MRPIIRAELWELRFLKLAIAYLVFAGLTCLLAQWWIMFCVTLALLLMLVALHQHGRQIYRRTLVRRALKRELLTLLRQILGNSPDWVTQTDHNLIGIERPREQELVVFCIALNDISEGYDPISHTITAPMEIILIQKGYPDAFRFVGVAHLDEVGPGRFTIRDEHHVNLQGDARKMAMRNELVIATEDELKAMVARVEQARAN